MGFLCCIPSLTEFIPLLSNFHASHCFVVGRTLNLPACKHAYHELSCGCHGSCGQSRAIGCRKFCGLGGVCPLFAQTKCTRTIVVLAFDL
jgi:hypothetical protein